MSYEASQSSCVEPLSRETDIKFEIQNKRRHTDSATDRQERIKWWSQDTLKNARVMVVGAGAIGNEVLKNLALMGVGYILIVDYDDIELSNLSRTALFRHEDIGQRKAAVAAQRTQELSVNANAVVEFIDNDIVWELGLGVYRRMDVVLGCLDNVEARLSVNQACMLNNKTYIDGGIRELAGSVYVFAPPFECCFSCTTTQRERQAVGGRYDSCFHTLLSGYTKGKMATIQTSASIIAGMQVEQTMKFLHERHCNVGMRIQYDGNGKVPYFDVTSVYRRKGCDCEYIDPIEKVHSLEGSSDVMTLNQLIKLVEKNGIAEPIIKFPASFVPFLTCSRCSRASEIMQPLSSLSDRKIQCNYCCIPGDRESIQLTLVADSLDITEPEMQDYREELLNLPLSNLGFPMLHIILAQDQLGNSHHFELVKDEEVLLPGYSKTI